MSVPEHLVRLAPCDLSIHRRDRLHGSEFGTTLAAFDPDDRTGLARIYTAVKGLYDLWLDMEAHPDFAALQRYITGVDAGLIAVASRLGAKGPVGDARVRKLLHDVRGGGLAILIGSADLLREMPGENTIVRHCVSAARDHAKIMRAMIPDLDPETYAADAAVRLHTTAGFVAAWDGLTVRQGGQPAVVAVHCTYGGAITARCLETASVDRVLYNLANNAVRFAADGRVTLWIFPVGTDLVRWVVHNTLASADRDWLRRETGDDPGVLFAGGRTRGGTGIGLANCAEIVAACFGLGTPEDAVASGHLGAHVDAQNYYAWFHWPVCLATAGGVAQVTAA